MATKSKIKVLPIPDEVPSGILNAIDQKKLAIFVGAGVSRVIGCKGWAEIAERLIETCHNLEIGDKRAVNYLEKSLLEDNKNSKKVVSICREILKTHGQESQYYSCLEEALNPKQELIDKFDVYGELSKISALFITTNIDSCLDDKLPKKNVKFNLKDFKKESISVDNLYHIHGSLSNKKSLVLTTREYLERYNIPEFKEFLKKVFNEFTILFIGYGMEEFELLDFLVMKCSETDEVKHYFLRPSLNEEEGLLEFEKKYYLDLKTEVIPFSINENGYSQLFNVLKSWRSYIQDRSASLHDDLKEIDDLTSP